MCIYVTNTYSWSMQGIAHASQTQTAQMTGEMRRIVATQLYCITNTGRSPKMYPLCEKLLSYTKHSKFA